MSLLKKEPAPYAPPKYADHHVVAFQALSLGSATPDQQRAALSFLVNEICGTYEVSYRSASDRDTAFAEGRRFVGLQIVKLLKLNIGKIKKEGTNNGTSKG